MGNNSTVQIVIDVSAGQSTQAIEAVRGSLANMGVQADVSSKQSIAGSEGMLSSFGRVRDILGAIGITIGLTQLVSFLRDSVSMALEYEKAWDEVRIITNLNDQQIGALAAQIGNLNPLLGTSTQLAKGLFDTLKAGVEPAQSIDYVTTAAKLAKVTFSDLGTAVDIVTGIQKQYNLPASEAVRISDELFTVWKQSKGDLADFGGRLGLIISQAAGVHISLEDVLASYLVLKENFGTSKAALAPLGEVIDLISNQGGILTTKMHAVGVEFDTTQFHGKDLQECLRILVDYLQKNGIGLDQVVGSGRNMAAVLKLTTDTSGELAQKLDDLKSSAGAVDEKFGQLSQTVGERVTAAWNSFKDNMAAVGVAFVKFGDAALASVEILDHWFQAIAGSQIPLTQDRIAILEYAATLSDSTTVTTALAKEKDKLITLLTMEALKNKETADAQAKSNLEVDKAVASADAFILQNDQLTQAVMKQNPAIELAYLNYQNSEKAMKGWTAAATDNANAHKTTAAEIAKAEAAQKKLIETTQAYQKEILDLQQVQAKAEADQEGEIEKIWAAIQAEMQKEVQTSNDLVATHKFTADQRTKIQTELMATLVSLDQDRQHKIEVILAKDLSDLEENRIKMLEAFSKTAQQMADEDIKQVERTAEARSHDFAGILKDFNQYAAEAADIGKSSADQQIAQTERWYQGEITRLEDLKKQYPKYASLINATEVNVGLVHDERIRKAKEADLGFLVWSAAQWKDWFGDLVARSNTFGEFFSNFWDDMLTMLKKIIARMVIEWIYGLLGMQSASSSINVAGGIAGSASAAGGLSGLLSGGLSGLLSGPGGLLAGLGLIGAGSAVGSSGPGTGAISGALTGAGITIGLNSLLTAIGVGIAGPIGIAILGVSTLIGAISGMFTRGTVRTAAATSEQDLTNQVGAVLDQFHAGSITAAVAQSQVEALWEAFEKAFANGNKYQQAAIAHVGPLIQQVLADLATEVTKASAADSIKSLQDQMTTLDAAYDTTKQHIVDLKTEFDSNNATLSSATYWQGRYNDLIKDAADALSSATATVEGITGDIASLQLQIQRDQLQAAIDNATTDDQRAAAQAAMDAFEHQQTVDEAAARVVLLAQKQQDLILAQAAEAQAQIDFAAAQVRAAAEVEQEKVLLLARQEAIIQETALTYQQLEAIDQQRIAILELVASLAQVIGDTDLMAATETQLADARARMDQTMLDGAAALADMFAQLQVLATQLGLTLTLTGPPEINPGGTPTPSFAQAPGAGNSGTTPAVVINVIVPVTAIDSQGVADFVNGKAFQNSLSAAIANNTKIVQTLRKKL
jgi:TP901 family phage tail tape measure protein